MSDNHIGVEPLHCTDPADPGPLSEADRAARIEQLLLSGLDHYFGGNYEQAINVWTRVAFLERGHGRARAYIERARSALAERQRESEESLHQGICRLPVGRLAARPRPFDARGRAGRSQRACADVSAAPRTPRFHRVASFSRDRTAPGVSSARRGRKCRTSTRRTRWLATVAASVVITALILLGTLRTASWLRESPVEVRTGEVGDAGPVTDCARRRAPDRPRSGVPRRWPPARGAP